MIKSDFAVNPVSRIRQILARRLKMTSLSLICPATMLLVSCSKNEPSEQATANLSPTPASTAQSPASTAESPASAAQSPPSAETADTHYELGTKVSFNGSGGSERFRVSGWSSTETDKTWTEGNSAVLKFTGLPQSQPLMLKMTLVGLTKEPELPAQPTAVYANGKKITDWQVNEKKEYTAAIPADAVSNDGVLTLELRIPKATSPKALDQNPDPRILGLCCFDLLIEKGS
jgi:hypothetical protein